MRRGLRAAWYSTIVLLPVTALQGVLQSSPLSVPLIVLSILAIPNVLYNRKQFDLTVEVTTAQLAAGAAIVGAQIYVLTSFLFKNMGSVLNRFAIGRQDASADDSSGYDLNHNDASL